jgi:methylmalonyl-CoA/ethylmalonyl-CoA epimerase
VVLSGIDHVGCATENAAGLADRLVGLLDVPIAHEEQFESMQVVFLEVGEGYLELLEPTTDDGPIARHLATQEAGIHHVAFATPDIDAALERARDHGVGLVDETPRPGAWGHEVAFLHPRDTGGILVEFLAR